MSERSPTTSGARARRAALRGRSAAARVLTFRVGDERFAVRVTDVERVERRAIVRRLPDAAPWIEGAALHGESLIPIIDLRARLGLDATAWSDRARTLIVRDALGAFGVSVDEVLDVTPIEDDVIAAAPTSVRGLSGEYLRGMTRLDGEVVLVLDLTRLASSDERLRLTAAIATHLSPSLEADRV